MNPDCCNVAATLRLISKESASEACGGGGVCTGVFDAMTGGVVGFEICCTEALLHYSLYKYVSTIVDSILQSVSLSDNYTVVGGTDGAAGGAGG